MNNISVDDYIYQAAEVLISHHSLLIQQLNVDFSERNKSLALDFEKSILLLRLKIRLLSNAARLNGYLCLLDFALDVTNTPESVALKILEGYYRQISEDVCVDYSFLISYFPTIPKRLRDGLIK